MATTTVLSLLIAALLASPCAATADPVALLQGKVSVHDAAEWHMAKGKYLVDNTFLQHKGPGVLWRQSKNLTDIVGKDQFAAWGTVLDGIDSGDGWMKVGKYYLPTTIRGKQVVTPQDLNVGQPLMKLKITYSPTEIKAQDGSWVPCTIISIGSKHGHYNVEVTPKKFASYNLTNVPADMLKKVHRIREFVPAPVPSPMIARAPAPAPLTSARHVPIKDSEELAIAMEGFLVMKVKNPDGEVMELKTLKKSPLRTMMKMACDRVNLSWQACRRKMIFKRKGALLLEDDHPYELDLAEGEEIEMVARN